MTDRDNVEGLVVLQPISVDTRSPDQTGMLMIANGLLVAVLVRLDAPEHERAGPGTWRSGLVGLRACEPHCSTPWRKRRAG